MQLCDDLDLLTDEIASMMRRGMVIIIIIIIIIIIKNNNNNNYTALCLQCQKIEDHHVQILDKVMGTVFSCRGEFFLCCLGDI